MGWTVSLVISTFESSPSGLHDIKSYPVQILHNLQTTANLQTHSKKSVTSCAIDCNKFNLEQDNKLHRKAKISILYPGKSLWLPFFLKPQISILILSLFCSPHMQSCMSKDGLSRLWNHLVKDGELTVGDSSFYNSAGALAKKGKDNTSIHSIMILITGLC